MENTSASLRASHTSFGWLAIVAMVLLIVGGLNWALVGIAGVDLVATLFGTLSLLSRLVYILVGLSALYWIVALANGRLSAR